MKQMKFDFSELPLKNRAFSEKPMTFGNAEPKSFLSAIIDVMPIETGKRKARENWQKAQLRNLFKHARRDLALNRTRLRSFSRDEFENLGNGLKTGFTAEVTENWLGPLGGMIKSGINKHINCWLPNIDLLLKELSKDPIGYLVGPPGVLEVLLQGRDLGTLKKYKTEMLIPLAEETSPDLRKALDAQNIPVRSGYSSEEVSLIGSECEAYPSHYHVAHSNVIVEIDKNSGTAVGDKTLGRVLLTHLHSYATPFIRYDVGDFGALADTCKCGHDGPTLSDIMGRSKALIKHADGRLTRFHVRASEMTKVAAVEEYRNDFCLLSSISSRSKPAGEGRARTGRRRSSKTCSSMPMSGLHSGASGSGQRGQATWNYPICRFSRETTSSAK
jgi:hypothetical protein